MPIIITFFLLGLSFGSGPCLASCGPLLISYTAGTRKNPAGGLSAYALFSLARVSVYLAIGLAVYFLGRFLAVEYLGVISRYVLILGGAFIISVGVLLILGKNMHSGICGLLRDKFLQKDKKSIIIMGLIIGLLPCAPLLAVFSYIGLTSKSWHSSLAYAFSFGAGTLVSPLLVLTALAGLLPRLLTDKKPVYERAFNFLCGGIMVFLGAQLVMRAF